MPCFLDRRLDGSLGIVPTTVAGVGLMRKILQRRNLGDSVCASTGAEIEARLSKIRVKICREQKESKKLGGGELSA
jgi:hypothetical protein